MIPSELESYACILEQFEAVRRQAVRLGSRLCDLSYANPYESGSGESSRAVLRDVLEADRGLDLQYTPFGGHTVVRRVVADALGASHALPFTFDDVILTPGATAALHTALRTAGAPGDEVIIPVPCWLDYPLYARYLGFEPVFVPLAERTFQLDADAVGSAITPRTCAILLSNPANPTGQSYDLESLKRLARVLRLAQDEFGRTITWISDEAHRDFAPAGSFHTPAAVWPKTLVVYSFGKYHLMQGQRAGYVAVSPLHPRRGEAAQELVRWTRIMGFGAPTAVMQRALPRLQAIRHDLEPLDRWRARYASELSAAGFRVVPPATTFFMYVAVPDGWDDFAFVRRLARAGVLVLPSRLFHHHGYVRLSLTGSDAMLGRALSALRALDLPEP